MKPVAGIYLYQKIARASTFFKQTDGKVEKNV